MKTLAPRVGFEPTTLRLTAECSTVELPRNMVTAPTITANQLGKSQILTIAQPIGKASRPGTERNVAPGEANAVGAFFIDMQLRRDAMFTKGEIEENAVLRRDTGVGIGMEKKAGRRFPRNGLFVR